MRKNAGETFEELIRWQNQRYKAAGEAIIIKVPTEFKPIRNAEGRIYTSKVEHKSTVDFIGRIGRYPVAIEAKHTEADRISLIEIKDHQAEFLDAWSRSGFASVIVSFGMREFYLVPWDVWGTARKLWQQKTGNKAAKVQIHYTNKRKSLVGVEAHVQTWHYNGMGSIHKNDMDPAWKIGCNGQNGLPYLEAIL